MKQRVHAHIEESISVKQAVRDTMCASIADAANLVSDTLAAGGKLMFCGNGGSAADAQHLATEFVVRLRSEFNRPALAALALTVDTSTLTAAANDFGAEQIFSRQVEALGQPGDLLIAISTSGNSPNIIKAVEIASLKGLSSLGLLGGDGGKLAALVGTALIVPSKTTSRIQEAHIMIGHILCELTETRLFSDSGS